jgi:uncharacterized protein (DUF58 family)
VLTTRGRRTVALGLLAGLAGRILAIPELFGLAAGAVVVALAALLQVKLSKAVLTVQATALPAIVDAGEPARLELAIEQSRAAGIFAASVVLCPDPDQGSAVTQPDRVVVARLSRGERALASFPLPTQRRGVFLAGAYEARLADPLGLASRKVTTSRAARCVVLPRIEPLATVLPTSLGWLATESSRSSAERLVSGSSMLRRYVQGDDLRLVHWPTTARLGELMVREGGDREDPEQAAVTVLLDSGDATTLPTSLDRVVEVAASVLSVAAAASNDGSFGNWRLVTTTGSDSGARQGYADLQETLIALAGLATPLGRVESLGVALARRGRPDRQEALVVVGASHERLADISSLEQAATWYSAVVVVLVGQGGENGSRDENPLASRRSFSRVVTVRLQPGQSLSEAWDIDMRKDAAVELGELTSATWAAMGQ